MGLFNKSSSKPQKPIEELMGKIFPNGKSDIIAGAWELLTILDHTISREAAYNIFSKSMTIAVLTEQFTIDRLKEHLDGYCKGIFSQDEMIEFHKYLTARKAALMMGRSYVTIDPDGGYSW